MDNLIGWMPRNHPNETGTAVVHGRLPLDNADFPSAEPKDPRT